MMNPGEAYLAHYERFFGQVDYASTFRFDGLTIQLLEYAHIMQDAHVIASLGLTKFQPQLKGVLELVIPVSEGGDLVRQAIVQSLSFLLAVEKCPVHEISYVRHLHRTVPEFYRKYGKSALAFTAPYPFPDEFSSLPIPSSERNGSVLMGFFISDAEVEFIEREGVEAFTDRLEAAEIDIIELTRPSVV